MAPVRDERVNLFSQALVLVAWAFVVSFVEALVDLLLLLWPSSEKHVVDEGIFQKGQEHEYEAAHEVDVDGFHVGDLWEGLPQVGVNGGHSEDRGDPCNKEKKHIISANSREPSGKHAWGRELRIEPWGKRLIQYIYIYYAALQGSVTQSEKKAPSTLFHIHALRHTRNWLVCL